MFPASMISAINAPWFYGIFKPESVSLTVLVISVVATSGLALGAIRFKGLTIGIGGVMFTGLIVGRLLGEGKLNPDVMAFARDFGLILFVYAVGSQVGPGFLASLRKNGLPLNILATSVVLLGVLVSVCIARLGHVDMKVAAGLFAGGTTNAPAYGAAQEVLKTLNGPEGIHQARQLTGPAFALSYPFGLMGVILAMILLRTIFRADPKAEGDAIEAAERSARPALSTLNVEVKNPNLHGLLVSRITDLHGERVVISRLLQKNVVVIARPDTRVELGDVMLAIGPKQELEDFRLIVGNESAVDLRIVPSKLTTRQILVTNRNVLGRAVDGLHLPERLNVTITRVHRAGLEFTATGQLRLQFGDHVRAVGESDSLNAAAAELGDSVRDLNLPRLIPIFLGIALGVILGSIPIFIPHLPAPLKLGLAAGPMVVAIVLARIGRIGKLIWYMPNNSASILRELGITLFLIAVGVNAADGFFEALRTPAGLHWLMLGTLVTIIPLMIVGLIGKAFFKLNYLHICGLLAGSMTSPSLAFTSTMTTSEAPAVAFATVYPLTMVLRVLCAQLMLLIFS